MSYNTVEVNTGCGLYPKLELSNFVDPDNSLECMFTLTSKHGIKIDGYVDDKINVYVFNRDVIHLGGEPNTKFCNRNLIYIAVISGYKNYLANNSVSKKAIEFSEVSGTKGDIFERINDEIKYVEDDDQRLELIDKLMGLEDATTYIDGVKFYVGKLPNKLQYFVAEVTNKKGEVMAIVEHTGLTGSALIIRNPKWKAMLRSDKKNMEEMGYETMSHTTHFKNRIAEVANAHVSAGKSMAA